MYPFAKITEGGVILILFMRMEDSTTACSSSLRRWRLLLDRRRDEARPGAI
jgi:hypothetical protein